MSNGVLDWGSSFVLVGFGGFGGGFAASTTELTNVNTELANVNTELANVTTELAVVEEERDARPTVASYKAAVAESRNASNCSELKTAYKAKVDAGTCDCP